jgi:hypothetical protein
MRLEKASKEAIKYACLRFHYAKAIPGAGRYGYSVFNDQNEWCGVILFGLGTNKHIGTKYGLKQGEIMELVRMALNGKQESTSKALSLSLKLIRKDFPLLKMIVSYADVDQDHKGVIYQATNWAFVGHVNANVKTGYIIKGVRKHQRTVTISGIENIRKKYKDPTAVPFISKGKLKYLYPFTKEMVKLCEGIKKPYPKANIV